MVRPWKPSTGLRDDETWLPQDRINTLNQIMRQDVDSKHWKYTWDANGNLTEKTSGAETYTYVWNDENRLIQVSKEVTVGGGWGASTYEVDEYEQTPSTSVEWTVSYTYDMAGRMMSRDDGTNVTTFTWDKFDCIREQTGMSTTTYCIPEGVLTSFIRDGDRYDVHTDHVMSVRMVTDENGDVVLRREFDAFGGELAGNFDNVPGGFDYGFVGSLGVRRDELTGLFYMRQRWYSSQLGRFISRDPSGVEAGSNLYAYCGNHPLDAVDPMGNDEIDVWQGVLEGVAITAALSLWEVELAGWFVFSLAGYAGYTFCTTDDKAEKDRMLGNLLGGLGASLLDIGVSGGNSLLTRMTNQFKINPKTSNVHLEPILNPANFARIQQQGHMNGPVELFVPMEWMNPPSSSTYAGVFTDPATGGLFTNRSGLVVIGFTKLSLREASLKQGSQQMSLATEAALSKTVAHECGHVSLKVAFNIDVRSIVSEVWARISESRVKGK